MIHRPIFFISFVSLLQLRETKVNSLASEPQRALLGYITVGKETISRAEEELLSKVSRMFKSYALIRFNPVTLLARL